MARNLYSILGLEKNASDAEVKKAYRKLARKHHPDFNAGDKAAEEKFKEISQAYDILGDKEKREKYDRYGEAAFQAGFDPSAGRGGASASWGARGGGNPFGGFDMGDIFENFFGAGERRASGPRRGADMVTSLEIPFEDAVKGTTRELSLEKKSACPDCGGMGDAPGARRTVCPDCGGTGVSRTAQGPIQLGRTCLRCGGRGKLAGASCAKCSGSGVVRGRESITVKIPAGVETGSKVRLAGKGEPGSGGGPAGHLYIEIRVTPHRLFRREGSDLHLVLPVTVAEAALGASVKAPTVEGSVDLKIPPGTGSGRKLRLRGKGVPHLKNGKRGDLYVEVRIEVPKEISAEARKAIEEFDKATAFNPRENLN